MRKRTMAKQSDRPERNPWLAPFEAGRQWMELATKAQTVLSEQMKKEAIPAPFSQEAVPRLVELIKARKGV